VVEIPIDYRENTKFSERLADLAGMGAESPAGTR
jgi:hypothetical protein